MATTAKNQSMKKEHTYIHRKELTLWISKKCLLAWSYKITLFWDGDGDGKKEADSKSTELEKKNTHKYICKYTSTNIYVGHGQEVILTFSFFCIVLICYFYYNKLSQT